MAPRNDIAIYAPFAFHYYEDPATFSGQVPKGGVGAEWQTRLLAEPLARQGFRVAHIVYERERPIAAPVPLLELVRRKPWAGRRGLRGKLSEALRVWRSLSDANATAYVFRGGGAHLVVGAAFCLLRRRTLVVSACRRSWVRIPSAALLWTSVRSRRPETSSVARLIARSRGGSSDRSDRNTLCVPELVRTGGREVLKVARAVTPTHDHLRSRLVFLFVATVVFDAAANGLILVFERHAKGTEITTLGDALFWTSTQLLTVSSQLPNPISTPARLLDVFLQAYAISAVAILAGSFGAFFNRRSLERDPPRHLSGRPGLD